MLPIPGTKFSYLECRCCRMWHNGFTWSPRCHSPFWHRPFRRREVMAIAETPTGEQIAIPTVEYPESSTMECSASVQEFVAENCPELAFPNDYNEEIEEDA